MSCRDTGFKNIKHCLGTMEADFRSSGQWLQDWNYNLSLLYGDFWINTNVSREEEASIKFLKELMRPLGMWLRACGTGPGTIYDAENEGAVWIRNEQVIFIDENTSTLCVEQNLWRRMCRRDSNSHMVEKALRTCMDHEFFEDCVSIAEAHMKFLMRVSNLKQDTQEWQDL